LEGELILHITSREDWEAAQREGEYRADTLETEGFIHSSTPQQVLGVANSGERFRRMTTPVLLCIDAGKVVAKIRYENLEGGESLYPHIYGPLNLDAVVDVVDFPPDADGKFSLPPEIQEIANLESEPPVTRRDESAMLYIKVVGTNYDGQPHWQHAAWLVRHEEGHIVTMTQADLEIETETGIFISPFNTRGHYWTDRWFNVIRLELPEEGLFGFYCNIATPVEYDGKTARYADLQLDVRVYAEDDGSFTCEVCDEDEFEIARERYQYPDDLVERCRAAIAQIMAAVEAREYPFGE
jgi:uncharacterized protein (DUF952 family)/protein associated with RNAse G/E